MYKSLLKYSAFSIAFFMSVSASAVTIDFNDFYVEQDEEHASWNSYPVGPNDYLDKGLIIENAYIHGNNIDNYLMSGWATLKFVGELPTSVEMFVGWYRGGSVDFYGTSGFLHQAVGEMYSSQYVKFSYAGGIREISISDAHMRGGAYIDNITYTYASVPEPTPVILIALGFAGSRCAEPRLNTYLSRYHNSHLILHPPAIDAKTIGAAGPIFVMTSQFQTKTL